jgi:hypothetical protein
MPRIKQDEGLVPVPDTPGHRLLRGESKGPIPEFVPSEDQRHAVMVFAANGAARQVMADILKINVATLNKHFKHEIAKGRDHITGRVGFVIVREALGGNIGAAKYWLDRHGGEAWQPKGAYTPDQYDPSEDNPEETFQFYLPENGRDRPEDEPPTIEGDADDLKTGTDDG